MSQENQPQHVLHIELGRHVYGGARQVLYLLEGLAKRGVHNTVVAEAHSEFAAKAKALGAEVLALKTWGDMDIRLLWRLRQMAKQVCPDVVHVHSRRGADHWAAWALGSRLPVICTRRVDNLEPGWWAHHKAKRFAKLVCISDGIANVQRALGVRESKLQVIKSAVDTELFKPSATSANPMRWAMVAQLIPRKGHAFAFRCWQQLVQQYPDLHLDVYGQGDFKTELSSVVSALKLKQHVTFKGFCQNMHERLPHYCAVLHPAKQEGLGVALLEAGSCGVPVVAHPVGGIPEVVMHEQTGLLSPVGDTQKYVACIKQCLDDLTLRQRLASQAREHVLAHFALDRMVEQNLALYQTCF